MMSSQRVVYLFGTGATQADASMVDDRVHLGMSYIKDGIFKKIEDRNIKELRDARNELAAPSADVEQLITLYESSNSSKHKKIATFLRELFREEILEQIAKLDNSSSASGGKFTPRLYSALIDMHEIDGIGEQLCGIMTLNYEDMIERAAQSIKGGVNYSLDIAGTKKTGVKVRKRGLTILKLHGSFNWRNEFPLSVEDTIVSEEDVLWIPPGVEKHNETYPFNLIWGKARELLNCETLRIIGCSLSRNEWHLVSMLYVTQKLKRSRNEYNIEIISSPSTGNKIKEAYPHLKIKRIYDIKEVRDFVISDLSTPSSKPTTVIKDDAIIEYLDNKNIFDIWLRAKGQDLKSRGISLDTSKHVFRDYMGGRLK